ncbi:MAG: lytic murein transglycosylase B [Gammaproteobacteria bacterium]|nr:lytic murein transglycosylase B [Gammaproteobacteria bacterium]
MRCAYLFFILMLSGLLAAPAPLQAAEGEAPYVDHPDYDAFVQEVGEQFDIPAAELEPIFQQAFRQQKILDAISRPAEGKDWSEYRPIFLTEERISGGVDFWNKHARTLARAEAELGVDAEIIVAIIGVETYYGRITGSWRVIDALSTLAFDYPPRQTFFRSELRHFMQLVREENIDPLSVQGSYAGAMGGGQFMPSSYRQYAVDFDTDGQRDLWNSWPDAIGSVANYLSRHGWEHGAVIAVPAGAGESAPLQEQGMKVYKASRLRQQGLVFSDVVDNGEEVRLVALQQDDGLHYWIGRENFRVITRYNRSPLYAMAVMDLGRVIEARRQQAILDKAASQR